MFQSADFLTPPGLSLSKPGLQRANANQNGTPSSSSLSLQTALPQAQGQRIFRSTIPNPPGLSLSKPGLPRSAADQNGTSSSRSLSNAGAGRDCGREPPPPPDEP